MSPDPTPPAPPNIQKRHQTGLRGEWIALFYLFAKGYWPLARRVRSPFAELDLICRRRHLLVLVEVKTRRNLDQAISAFNPAQSLRARKGLDWWLSRNPGFTTLPRRIDGIALAPWRFPLHLQNITMV